MRRWISLLTGRRTAAGSCMLFLGIVMLASTGVRSGADANSYVAYLSRFVAVPIARHLAGDTEPQFQEYAGSLGLDAVNKAYSQLLTAPSQAPPEDFTRMELELAPACRRLARALAEVYGLQVIAARYAAYERQPLPARRKVVSLTIESVRLVQDVTTPLNDKAERCLSLIKEAESVGFSSAEMYAIYCELLPRLHRDGELRQALERGICTAESAGDYSIASQMLGQLGAWHAEHGDTGAMRDCWDRALAHARRIKSWQEARILSFYANHYWEQGQVVLSREYLLQAQARCRELRAARNEMRFLVQSIERYARMECWSIVDRELAAVDALIGTSREVWDPSTAETEMARIEIVRAARTAAGGDCDRSQRYAASALRRLRDRPPSPWGEQARLSAARALVRCGKDAEADRVLTTGRNVCEQFHIPELLAAFDLEIAAGHLRDGDPVGAVSALQHFRTAASASPDSVTRQWVQHDIHQARAALLLGDSDAAFRSFRTGLGRAVGRLRRLGSSPEAHLAWTEAQALRELGHAVLGPDPRIQYAFEMSWRRLRAGGNRAWVPAVHDAAAFKNQLLREAAELERGLTGSNSIHCVFGVMAGALVRWTVVDGRVERTTLATSPAEVEAWIVALRAGLRKQTETDPGLVEASWRLGQALLPGTLFAPNTIERVLISGDGVLTGLPFTVLSLSPTHLDPLVEHYDVASLRFHDVPAPCATGPPVIVLEPQIAPSLFRRYPFLQQPLPRAAVEAAHARGMLAGAALLQGPAATKRAVLDAAVRAPVIYLASHIVQDPELPYVAFVPLTPGEASGRADDAYLELADIRTADLSGCRLAVLSGCGSGRNYASTVATCPSLGEALVDAGVRAAVHTDVDVRDADAETSMVEFLDVWQGGPDPVHALTVAQRRAHRAGRAPAVWAAYAITLGSLVDRGGSHDAGVAAPSLLSGGPLARRLGSDDD